MKKQFGKRKHTFLLGLFIALGLLFPFVAYQAKLWIEPTSGTYIQGCEYPFTLKMDVEGGETTAVDSRLILSGFEM